MTEKKNPLCLIRTEGFVPTEGKTDLFLKANLSVGLYALLFAI